MDAASSAVTTKLEAGIIRLCITSSGWGTIRSQQPWGLRLSLDHPLYVNEKAFASKSVPAQKSQSPQGEAPKKRRRNQIRRRKLSRDAVKRGVVPYQKLFALRNGASPEIAAVVDGGARGAGSRHVRRSGSVALQQHRRHG